MGQSSHEKKFEQNLKEDAEGVSRGCGGGGYIPERGISKGKNSEEVCLAGPGNSKKVSLAETKGMRGKGSEMRCRRSLDPGFTRTQTGAAGQS